MEKQYQTNNKRSASFCVNHVKNLILLFLVALYPWGIMAQTTLFSSPFTSDYNSKDMPYRIPAIVETVDRNFGTPKILAFADKRHGGGDVGQSQSNNNAINSHIDLVYKYSTDNGATWSSEQTIIRGNQNFGYGDVAVVADRENPQNIVLFCAAGSTFFTNSSSSNRLLCYSFRSSDGGATWDNGTNVTNSIYGLFSYKGAFFSSGRICQSSKIKVGTHYRLYAALCVTGTNSIVLYSDDFGATWNVLGGNGIVAVSGGDEAKCEELPNGSVLVSSRAAGTRYFNVFNYNDVNYTSGSWSGKTSGIEMAQYSSNSTNGEILIIPAIDRTGNVCHIALQSVPYGTKGSWISKSSKRSNVSIYWKKLSSEHVTSATEFQDGWTRKEISSTTSAYSTMILQSDNNIGFLYEENEQSYGTGGYDIQYQNLSLETITGDQYSVYKVPESTMETVAMPIIGPESCMLEPGTQINIACETEGASIYYTLDGTDPSSENGTLYTVPFSLGNTATVKAIAVKDGWNNSIVSTSVYYTYIEKYRIKNIQMDGKAYYFKYTGEQDGLRTTTDVNEATIYYVNVQDETNGAFTFQSEDGNYMIFCGRDLSRENDRGYNNGLGYYNTYDAEKCNLTIAPMHAGGEVKSSAGEYMTIMGKRYKDKTSSTSAGVYDAYFVITKDGKFDGADTPYFNENYSSAFVFEYVSDNENEGGNDEEDNNGDNDDNNNEEDDTSIPKTYEITPIKGKMGTRTYYMATFSAEEAVMVPNNVNVYIARQADEESISLTRLPQGKAVPAGEGVILSLRSESPVTLTVAPEGTPELSVSGNLLVGTCSAESTVLHSDDYIFEKLLSGKYVGQLTFSVVGDKIISLPSNSAFLRLASGMRLARVFMDEETTGINVIGAQKENIPVVYDLQGRCVQTPSKGLYIINGKKVLYR